MTAELPSIVESGPMPLSEREHLAHPVSTEAVYFRVNVAGMVPLLDEDAEDALLIESRRNEESSSFEDALNRINVQ